MPFFKRKRKYYKKRKPYKRYGSKTYRMAKSALIRVKRLKPEHKYYDVSGTATLVDYDGSVIELNDVAQGDTDTTRNGDQLAMISLMLRFYAVINSTARCTFRLIVFYDSKNVVAIPTDILSSTYVGTSLAPMAPKSHDKRFDSKILYDVCFPLIVDSDVKIRKKLIKLNSRRTQFQGGSTTINSGSLKMLLISSLDSAANPPAIYFAARLGYTDV